MEKKLSLSVCVLLLVLISFWSLNNPYGYYVLYEYSLGRLVAAVLIILLTSVDLFVGIMSILLYICLQVCYYLDYKFKFQQNYIEQYYSMIPNPQLLSRNAEAFENILDEDDYNIPPANRNNELFTTNKAILDERIHYENLSTRNPLNRIIDHSFPVQRESRSNPVFVCSIFGNV